ncbi:MAG: hypothetical protein Q9216_000531 [Gyalolechia sp. 2 TL-2023]
MLSSFALLGLVAAVQANPVALPQAVTAAVSPSAPPPPGCTLSAVGSYGIAVRNPEVVTMATVSMITDGQLQAGMHTMMMMPAQIGDGQIQVSAATTTYAPVTVIADGQPQAPTLPAPTTTAAPVSQITDAQPQAPAVTSPPQASAPSRSASSSGPQSSSPSGVTNVACQTEDTLAITLADGILKDAKGRTGYIASNFQFQFDAPPQAGAIYTSGFTACGNGKMAPIPDATVWIEDIRQNDIGDSVLDELRNGLRPVAGGEKRLPTLLLYDEKGLGLFEDISYLDEYYPTNAEIEILRKHAAELATLIPQGCTILELGAGKVEILLGALESARKNVQYYALDLSEPELQRTLSALPKRWEHVQYRGLLGTYDDGLDWLQRPELDQQPIWILSLGSSIGNFGRQDAASFLQGFANKLRKTDVVVVGLDACQNKDKVYHAYNDREGKTHEFILNGLLHANRLLGKDVFKPRDWEVIGEYDEAAGRHQAFYSPLKDLIIDGVYIEAGEKVRVEESYKYSSSQSDQLWCQAGLVQQSCFTNSTGDYHLHVLVKSDQAFPLKPAKYAAQPVPGLDDFKQLWSAWDLVTQCMIPKSQLLSQPITLRHCYLFYLGHIPTFLDIHLTRATGQAPTGPASYHRMFERGIDPDVDNPEHCHAHSEVPEEWPPVGAILDYQNKLRSRVETLLEQPGKPLPRKIERALWLSFEHEAMHLETFLYMLLQSDQTLPPPGRSPNFPALAHEARGGTITNEWIKIPSTTMIIGMNDPESDLGPPRYFGWDNEKPARKIHVPAFEAKARPLTNEDYMRYLYESGTLTIPASWSQVADADGVFSTATKSLKNGYSASQNGCSQPLDRALLMGKSVKTVYGPVSLQDALTWPVLASYDELAGCAKWMNGRIPTADEVRTIYNHVDLAKKKEAEKVLVRKVSAVNGHLSNDGVEETPPPRSALHVSSGVESDPDPMELFANLEGCNVGFRAFHPTSVAQFGNKLCGRGETGGAWEWTSSTLEEHEGFVAMDSYPGWPLNIGGTVAKESTALTPTNLHSPTGQEGLHHAVNMIYAAFRIEPQDKTVTIQQDRRRRNHCPTHIASPHRRNRGGGGIRQRCRQDKCRKTVELHDKRHREIAALVLKIRKHDEAEQAFTSSTSNRKRKTRKSDIFDAFKIPLAQDNIHEEGEWADSSTLNEDESDFTSPDIPGLKDNCIPKRATKAEKKRARRSGLVQIITPEFMNIIDVVLHPANHPFDDKEDEQSDACNATLSHKIIEDNIAFNAHCFKPSSMRQSVHTKKLLKANGIGKAASPRNAQEDPEITLLVERLGISSTRVHSSRERTALVKQLRNAIRDDTEKVENETRDTMMRMAGYWRYVNRKTYNFMVRQNQIWDWATGQKLEEIEEEDESELDTEDDRGTQGTFWDDTSTLGTPLNGVGTPYSEVEDYAGDFQLDELRDLRLIDKETASDKRLKENNDEQREAGGDTILTTRANQGIFKTPETRTRIPEPRAMTEDMGPPNAYTVSRKDTRHLRPTSISTLKTDEPFDFVPPSPSSPATPTFSTTHHDPNNRYHPLAKLNGGPNQRPGRVNRSLKVAPAAVLPLTETTNTWANVNSKSLTTGKTSYAGVLKKAHP